MKQKHIECLNRLFSLSGCKQELVQFMLDEKLMSKEDATTMKLEKDQTKFICVKLFEASKQEKIQLLQFEWVMLPIERVRLKIVTDMHTKEYAHNF